MNKEFYQEAFDGYDVPENIKQLSIEICNRFTISGICDPMYITNVIGTENNIGDGKGNFTDNKITKPRETAIRIQSCYGCNIMGDEIPEIEYCFKNGFMDKQKAIAGLKAYTKRINKEIKTCDEWRKDYLNKVLSNINKSIEIFSEINN